MWTLSSHATWLIRRRSPNANGHQMTSPKENTMIMESLHRLVVGSFIAGAVLLAPAARAFADPGQGHALIRRLASGAV
jgi:hypothetical protein